MGTLVCFDYRNDFQSSFVGFAGPLPVKRPVNDPDLTYISVALKAVFHVSYSPPQYCGMGVYNVVWTSTPMDSNSSTSLAPAKVVVRVARKSKADSDMSIDSEVATMIHIKRKTTIAVPTVYAYCPNSDNPVGLPFIIMSFVEGTDIWDKKWSEGSPEMKRRTVRDYAKMVSELSKISFDRIGSLYFDSTRPGAVKVGPLCRAKSVASIRRSLPLYDRGPWKKSVEWVESYVKDELQLLVDYPDILVDASCTVVDFDTDHPIACRVYKEFLDYIPEVVGTKGHDAGPFFLSHLDFGQLNFHVSFSGPDAGKIVGILDWEMSATVPLWYLAGYPKWFDKISPWEDRDPKEAQMFKDTYATELTRLGHSRSFINVAEADVDKRQIADLAMYHWPSADLCEEWMKKRKAFVKVSRRC